MTDLKENNKIDNNLEENIDELYKLIRVISPEFKIYVESKYMTKTQKAEGVSCKC